MAAFFKNAFLHWQTTGAGLIAGALTAWAAIPGLEQLPLSQQLAKLGGAVFVAVMGLLAKDASKAPAAIEAATQAVTNATNGPQK